MDKKSLKKLSKKKLINMILEQSDIIEKNKNELEQANKMLCDRQIKIDKAGTMAEAVLLLNGVFEATEKAAAQYLENIERLSGEQDRVMKEQLEEHERQMQLMYNDTRDKCEAQKMKTQKECEDMIANAENQVQDRWSTLELKWETFCEARKDMRDVLDLLKNDNSSKL